MSREKLEGFLKASGARYEIIVFSGSVHTVSDAAREAGVSEKDLIKTVVCVAGISPAICVIPGEMKLDLGKLREISGTGNVRIAKPDEVLKFTGYPAGGVPPVFAGAEKVFFLIDRKVLLRETVLGGGGDSKSLLKISPREIVRLSGARTEDISTG